MKRILNFGSLNIDCVFSVPHFVQPGETLSALDFATFPGGKGLNQSLALARAGANVSHAGCIGSDGAWLSQLLLENGVDVSLIKTVPEHTGQAIIQVAENGQNCIILHGGANRAVEGDYIAHALACFEKGDLLVLQNEISGLDTIMKAAVDKGLQIALNPSPLDGRIPRDLLPCVHYFLLNEIEGEGLTGEQEPGKIAARLLEIAPEAEVVLTLGKAGVYYQSPRETLTHGIYNLPVVDTTAAGDTFTGFFLSSVVAGETAREALRRASVASSLAVSRKGAATSIPTLGEVLGFEG